MLSFVDYYFLIAIEVVNNLIVFVRFIYIDIDIYKLVRTVLLNVFFQFLPIRLQNFLDSSTQWQSQELTMGRLWRGLEARGSLGDFCNFSIKISHFYSYFGQNS